MSQGSPPIEVRDAVHSDLDAIVAIYNHAIEHTTATFDTEPKTVASQLPWFEGRGPTAPVLVALRDGAILGWADAHPWSDRCAYQGTGEVSVYVAEAARGQRIGSKLLGALVLRCREAGLHTLLARIASGNPTSLRLHEAQGFFEVGVMREVGKKFGQVLDVHLYQCLLQAKPVLP